MNSHLLGEQRQSVDEIASRKMNPAQLLNPKAFAKERAKAAKRTPNYGTSTFSLFSSFTQRYYYALISLHFHMHLSFRVMFMACDGWCLILVFTFGM